MVARHLPDCIVHHVLDDFIFISSTEEACLSGLRIFQDVCVILGVPLAEEKTVGLVKMLIFLGIELDTLLMEARLPQDKLLNCQQLICSTLGKKSLFLKSLQSIIGVLNFACNVVLPGQAFLRRLIQLLIGQTNPRRHIRLSRGSKLDLKMYASLELYTDAAASRGYGAVFRRSWFYGEWPPSWKTHNITFLELYPIVLAVETWASAFSNRCILFFTDNEAVVSVVNRQSPKDQMIMVLVRRLVLICLKFNIVFQAKHIPGVSNTLADLLSRLKLDRFKELTGDAMDTLPTPVSDPPSELRS